MNALSIATFGLSAIWVASEIVTNAKRFQKGLRGKHDRFSYITLITTAVIATGAAVYIDNAGIAGQPGNIRWGSPLVGYAGCGLMIAGTGIRWTAIMTLRKQFTVNVSTGKDSRLIDHGIYHIVRHPAYSGSLLTFLGLGIAMENWLSTAIIFVPILIAHVYRIMVEESALIERFGNDYKSYSKRTKRLIPGLL